MFHLDEESNSTEIEPNLNNPMLVDEILSDFSDDSFYDAMTGDTSIEMKLNENILGTSEHDDSTSYFSLSIRKSRANSNKNNKQSDSNNRSAEYKIRRKLKSNNYFSWELNNECMNKLSEISDNTPMSSTDSVKNSKYEEPVCSDTVFCSSKTAKKTVKRRSLSVPEYDAG